MIEKNHSSLSVGAQCHLLSISRSSFYDEPMGETAMNLDLMVVIDKQFLETPFYGVQQMTWHLQSEGHVVNQKRIRRLMRLMRVRRENGPLDRFLTLLTLTQVTDLALQVPDPVLLRARQTAASASITFGLLAPDTQAVRRTAKLRRDCPLGGRVAGIVAAVLPEKPNTAFAELGRIGRGKSRL